MQTLKVYLQHNMNIAESARTLFLHRNSFLYRINRIEEILQVDLKSPDTRLLLLNALALLESSQTENFDSTDML